MPPQSLEALQQDGNPLKHKKKPVRRDTDRRRQQNVQAQKKYREKQRQHLETLKAIAASAGQGHTIEGPCSSTSPSEGAMHNYNSKLLDHGSDGTPLSQSTWDSHSVSGSSADVPDEFRCLIPRPDDTPSSFGIGNNTSVFSTPASTPGEWQLRTPLSDTHSPPPSPTWDSCTHISSSFLIHNKTRQSSSPYWTTTIDCGCLTPHVKLRAQDPSSHSDLQIISFGANSVAADPYMSNSIRIKRMCIAAALYTLMKYVGIGEETFCADDSPSPFYRPNLEFADDASRDRTICMVQQMFKTLKPDLRPIAEQITVEHHPYIDILPFPTLRRNLILHQTEIDEDEFLNDTLTGLVCWGGVGTEKKDPDSVTGHAAVGNVWDVRSWEAKGWFLKKYWRLLGGDEGELVRQSEWWRSVRGEEARIDLRESSR
ncbi:hypothetical protein LI328DRAFT_166275 [Trichoderma asperelloides]|nr:hypothetical protein LI328DRAFT_166275 [Trichoderma asperelloides]